MPGAGVPNLIRSDWARNLNRIYPPERGGFELPNVLAGHVQLVHDALGTISYQVVSIFDNVGAADSTSILQAAAVPEGFIWIVDELGIKTTDAVTRLLTVFLHFINAVGDFSVPIMSQDSGAVANRWWPIGRRFIMPPGSKLELTASALTAGQSLRYTMAYLQMPSGQFCPRS